MLLLWQQGLLVKRKVELVHLKGGFLGTLSRQVEQLVLRVIDSNAGGSGSGGGGSGLQNSCGPVPTTKIPMSKRREKEWERWVGRGGCEVATYGPGG